MTSFFQERIERELGKIFADREEGEIKGAAAFAVARTSELLTRHAPGCIARMRMREAALVPMGETERQFKKLAVYAPRTLRALRNAGWYE